jgi:CHAT domain-containing protein
MSAVKKIYLFLFIFWVIPILGVSPVVIEQFDKIEKLIEANKYKEALVALDEAVDVVKAVDKVDNLAKVYIKKGDLLTMLSENDEAYKSYQKAYAIVKANEASVSKKIVADVYDGLGRVEMYLGKDNNASVRHLEKALSIRLKLSGGSDLDVIKSYNHLAEYYEDTQEDSERAEIYLRKALDLGLKVFGEKNAEVGFTYELLGTNQFYQDDYEKAKEYYQKSLMITETVLGEKHPRTAQIYASWANFLGANKATRELRKGYLEKSLNIRLSILDEYNLAVGESFMGMAEYFEEVGDYDNAKSLFEKAKLIFINIYKTENTREVAEAYNGIARCLHQQDELDSELPNLEKALEIQKSLFPEVSIELTETYNNLAAYYGKQGDTESQLSYLNKLLDIYVQQYGDDNYRTSIAYANLGRAYDETGNETESIFFFNKAYEIRKKLFAEYDPPMGKLYTNFGKHYLKFNQTKQALTYFQKAIRSNVRNFKSDDIRENPQINSRQIASISELLDAIKGKGDCLMLDASIQNNSDLYKQALETYSISLDLLDSLRFDIQSTASRQERTSLSMPIYEQAIKICNILYNSTKDKKYVEQAFYITERSKSYLLLEALRESEALGISGIPDSLVMKERELKLKMTDIQQAINEAEKNKENITELSIEYNDTETKYKEFLRRLESAFPQYYNMKYSNKNAQIKEVQRGLLHDDKSILLEYFWGEKQIFIFAMTSENLDIYSVPRDEALDNIILNYRKNLISYDELLNDPQANFRQITETGLFMFNKFVKNAYPKNLSVFKRMVVIPDGVLSLLPFEAFLTEAPEQGGPINFSNLAYVVKKWTTSYGYSSNLLLYSNKLEGNPNGRSIAFAPSFENEAIKISSGDTKTMLETSVELPGAQSEVKKISKYIKMEPYFNENASEKHFKETVTKDNPHFSVVHLAMHGHGNNSQPNNSFLAFYKPKQEILPSDNDGKLHAYEINSLKFNADLVVLSACETGYGRLTRGEGVISMARSFLLSGAASIVMTLWKVNDHSTSELMPLFYKGLSNDNDKDEALKQAKNDYLKKATKISAHPAYWAGFVFLGNTQSLYSTPSHSFWRMRIAALVLAILGGYLVYSRYKKKSA